MADLELYVLDDMLEDSLEMETLADGNALASVSTAGTVGSASCPATSASSFTSFSSYT
ncbi:thiocillin family RiPP [Streptomyces griseoincarnatus]|uniref:thiocillin family RiPP n=1 Tax=unclassified Streptomyces TaxID=2593676 RepID=UPI002151C8C6|nr:thiocillin family RiPP [Streptomyces sp. KMM 9044]WAX78351.1 thiocillin family RiPP [Streptomyces sp. KMM 9044]